MIVRNPKLTFEEALPHWAPNAAFAQIINAASTSLPAVETYLNTVMARAAKVIADPALRQDIRLFIAQEGNHYRQHRLFNRTLAQRYPGLKPLEDRLQRDYEAMLAGRSLAYNAAYCEGFESLGIVQAEFFFERIDDLLVGADQRLTRLWQWHLAEEYEHRHVCFDVHHALGGTYLTRVAGFLRATRHLMAYGKAVSDHLLAVDRAGMSEGERRRSIRQERRYRRRLMWFALPRLVAILSPFYSPRAKRAPRGASEVLAAIPG